MTWQRMGVSWKVYVDQLRAADKDAVVVALAVADRALTEAKATLGKQLDAIIAKIDLLESHAGGAIPRLETESRLEALAERFTAQVTSLNITVQGLHDAVLRGQAKSSGVAWTGRMVAGVITALVGLAALVGYLWTVVPHK